MIMAKWLRQSGLGVVDAFKVLFRNYLYIEQKKIVNVNYV